MLYILGYCVVYIWILCGIYLNCVVYIPGYCGIFTCIATGLGVWNSAIRKDGSVWVRFASTRLGELWRI